MAGENIDIFAITERLRRNKLLNATLIYVKVNFSWKMYHEPFENESF